MANYLYYIGGADQRPSDVPIAGAIEWSFFDIGGSPAVVTPSTNAIIDAPTSGFNGQFCGDAYGGGGQSGAYNNNDNWTWHFNAAGFSGSPQVFVIGAVDVDQSISADAPGQVNGMRDRTGSKQDLVCHHGSKTSGVITVIAPGSVTKFGSQFDGTVLVWYIAPNMLGESGNAIGLPFSVQNYPVGGDTDSEAAAKILYQGCGVLRFDGTDMLNFGWIPQG